LLIIIAVFGPNFFGVIMSVDSPQIKAIKERYKASFPEKLVILQTLREAVENEADFEYVHEELHKLAGSSGMYGYDDIAGLCRLAMQYTGKDSANRQPSKLLSTLGEVINLLEKQI